MKATGLLLPISSVVEPMEGGSTMTSYIIPPVTRKYEANMRANTVMDEGSLMKDGFFSLRLGVWRTVNGML